MTDPVPPSGFQSLLGYRLAEWRAGEAVLELPLAARHMNRFGVLHGGVVATLIDTCCGYAATWSAPDAPPRFCVTLSLSTSFTGQARAGTVRAIGRVKGGGRKIVFATAEVLDAEGRLIGFGEGTFRYRSGSEG